MEKPSPSSPFLGENSKYYRDITRDIGRSISEKICTLIETNAAIVPTFTECPNQPNSVVRAKHILFVTTWRFWKLEIWLITTGYYYYYY